MATQHLDDVLSAESGFNDYSQAQAFKQDKQDKIKSSIKPAVAYGVGGATLLGLGYYVFNTNRAISLAYMLSGAGLLAMSIGTFGLGIGALLGLGIFSAWHAQKYSK